MQGLEGCEGTRACALAPFHLLALAPLAPSHPMSDLVKLSPPDILSEGCIDLTEDDDIIIEHQFVDLTSPIQENRIPTNEMEPVIVRHRPHFILTRQTHENLS